MDLKEIHSAAEKYSCIHQELQFISFRLYVIDQYKVHIYEVEDQYFIANGNMNNLPPFTLRLKVGGSQMT